MKRKINLLLLVILILGQTPWAAASSLQNKSGYSWYTYYYNNEGSHQSSVNDSATTTTATSHLYGLSNELTRFNLYSTYPGTTKKTLIGMNYSIKFPENIAVDSLSSFTLAASSDKIFAGDEYYNSGNSAFSQFVVGQENYNYSIDSATNSINISIPSTDYWKSLYNLSIEFYYNYPIFEDESKSFVTTITTPTNISYTFTDTLLYYHALTVNYVDGEGTPIADPDTIIDLHGASYNTKEKEITGYHLSNVIGSPSGLLNEDNLSVTYIYEKNSVAGGDVTVKYVDENGAPISGIDEITLSGNVGESYTTEQKDIEGYSFQEVQGNNSGQFTDQPQTVTYIYKKDVIAGGDVTVKYVDENGVPISGIDEITLSGNVGESYTTEQKDIDGYSFKEVQGNSSGQFTDQPQTVTYIYKKDVIAGGDVTVKYVDENGVPISGIDEITLSGNVGESYTTEQKDIDGYSFKEVQGNSFGQFTAQSQTVTYIYSKNLVDNSKIKVKDSTIFVGNSWKPEDNFVQAIDYYGNDIGFSDIVINGDVDTTSPGEYKVNYTRMIPNRSTGDIHEGTYSATATITVLENKLSVTGLDLIRYVGDKIPEDSEFNPIATDSDGSSLEVEIDKSKLDMSTPGKYPVTLSVKSKINSAETRYVTRYVTVKEKKTEINVHDSTINVGDSWNAKDNFDSAFDKEGQILSINDIRVDDSKVDSSTPGIYDVIYSYEGVTSIAKVTVVATTTSIPNDSVDSNTSSNLSHKEKSLGEKSRNGQKVLPKTGTSNGLLLSLTGLGILILLGMALFFKNKIMKK